LDPEFPNDETALAFSRTDKAATQCGCSAAALVEERALALAQCKILLLTMQFNYEISADEYVAGQRLYLRLKKGRNHTYSAVSWLVIGLLFVFIAWEEAHNQAPLPFILAVPGFWLIYCGTVSLFPARYIRRAYRSSDIAGKKYRAEVNEEGFQVAGDVCNWRIQWAGVSAKGENEIVFILFAANTIFMFGKQYLTSEQQTELRRLAAL
jgi:hypothetical protein